MASSGATAPFGTTAIQIGTLVKLVRVLMLGPVCVVLAMLALQFREESETKNDGLKEKSARPPLYRLVPWFIVGFIALASARSLGMIPNIYLGPIATTASLLTVISMAALGLGVDVHSVAKAGGRVSATAVLSLFILGGAALAAISITMP